MLKLKNFLKENKVSFIFFFIISLTYLLVLISFNLEKFPIIYGFLISFFIFLAYFIYKYFNQAEPTFVEISKNPSQREKIILDELENINKKYKDLLLAYNEIEGDLRDFYGLWIHEIKTPIAENKLILDEPNPDLDLLKKNNKRIEDYLNILLGFIRYNSKTNDYIFKEVRIEPIVKEIIREKSYDFISKKISLDVGDLGFMTVSDEKWLGFIIGQLLNNALKYTPEAGKIKVYFEKNFLIVEDNGIGIKGTDLPRVFEMGYTGENGRKPGSSTGLGLYLVKSIGKDLNLDIKIESEEGKFTKIMINFPKLTKL
ncbi:sensor histidine kinase [Anaerococcus lactolyticus]|uniref:sensor histidine kinase n=1 Tax=Anaerococcus lactolyticus TaxID=33032 RepID=UPI00288A1D30|nr:sensor histidine kinase [Anaerococcus lactolyticus]